jgi:predicted nucleotidyltransferase
MAMVEAAVPLLDEVRTRLVREFQPDRIILFGSYAWGEPTADSDLDLLLIVPDSEQSPTRRAQRAQRCLGNLRVPADILVKTRAEVDQWRLVPTSLVARVLAEGRVIYG